MQKAGDESTLPASLFFALLQIEFREFDYLSSLDSLFIFSIRLRALSMNEGVSRV